MITGLVPIKYNEITNKWVVTFDDDPNWYNYSMQRWANAASLTSSGNAKSITESLDLSMDVYAMFVWIPRFSYIIGCKGQKDNINLTLENGINIFKINYVLFL